MTQCAYFDRGACRSCSLLGEKDETAREAGKVGRFRALAARELGAEVPIPPLWAPTPPFSSRTKAKLSVSGTLDAPVIGLLDAGGQAGAELLDCPLHLPVLNQVLHAVRARIPGWGIAPYDVASRRGELKGLILKANQDGTEVMLRFVLRSRAALAAVTQAVPELQRTLPCLKVVSVNLQPVPHAVLEGEEEILLTSQTVLWEDFGAFALAFAPRSFSQVTHATARALYGRVAAALAREPARGMLDLYCGVGGFSFAAAPFVEWSHGVELSAEAIAGAELGRARNAAPHARFTAGDAAAFLRDYRGPRPEVILVNPPRRGLSPELVDAIAGLGPARVFYSSCNPETLVRDLGRLAPRYRVASLAPFDMFPLTEHLEVLAELRA